jgi:hypothetical protein
MAKKQNNKYTPSKNWLKKKKKDWLSDDTLEFSKEQ